MIKGGGKLSRINEDWINKVEEALSLKLFLVSESGPTNLLFKNESDEKFRIKISSKITCSCSKTQDTRCKHILFCMLKVFKVDDKSDLLFKETLNEQNINQILEGRYRKKAEKKKTKSNLDYLRTKKQKSGSKISSNSKTKRSYDKEDPCPICYEDIGDEGINRCKTCENPFHLECLVQWAKHKVSSNGANATQCPMCRTKWDSNPITTLKKLEILLNNFKKKEYLHPKKCSGCAKNQIIGSIYRCIWCPETYLCSECFDNSVHSLHGNFLFKEKFREKWKPCFKRLNKLKNIREVPLIEYLVNSLATCDSEKPGQNKGGDGLSIVGFHVNSKQCGRCSKIYENLYSIKRLPCDHKLCRECLKEQFNSKMFFCDLDGMPIFKGLVRENSEKKIIRRNSSNTVNKKNLRSSSKKSRPKSVNKKKDNKDRIKIGNVRKSDLTQKLPPLGKTEILREKGNIIKKLRERKEGRKKSSHGNLGNRNVDLNIMTSKMTHFNF